MGNFGSISLKDCTACWFSCVDISFWGAVSPQALLGSDRGSWVCLLRTWPESLAVSFQVRGKWVGRVSLRACPMSQDEAEWCQAALSEIRGGEDPISGLITHWPKLLLAKDEVLPCLAWLRVSERNSSPHLNSPLSFNGARTVFRQPYCNGDNERNAEFRGKWETAWDEAIFHVDLIVSSR